MMKANLVERTSTDPHGHGAEGAQPYALGYSESEFKRLERQASFLRDLTEDLLRRAGIERGMRVLDVGCGVGDVSLLAAELVGPSGEVIGVDRSTEAVAIAERRAAAAGKSWLRFATAELDTFAPSGGFDAVIGRLVLMYLADPVATLRRLSRHVRPGGIVAFQEMAMPTARSVPDGPVFARCRDWVIATFERAGFEIDMGGKLHATLLAAGFPAPQMIAAGRIGGGPQSPIHDYAAGVLRSLLPLTERLGIATAAEIDIDSLADRLRAEALENNACVMPPLMIGAWLRLPGN
jgi:ubiquinone/menaquinone biosynthesis C-methylase UbiE